MRRIKPEGCEIYSKLWKLQWLIIMHLKWIIYKVDRGGVIYLFNLHRHSVIIITTSYRFKEELWRGLI